MANRAELAIIRGARAGDAQSQLALGKLYLFGGASLPCSMPTALHWLSRAASQEQDEAWMLIGAHIPYEYALHSGSQVLPWYERAYEAGVAEAGVVWAQLVRSQGMDAAGQSPHGTAKPEPAVPCGLPAARLLPPEHGLSVLDEIKAAARLPGVAPDADAAGLERYCALDQTGSGSLHRLTRTAERGDRNAQLALGLWFARMDGDGERQAHGIAAVNFKRAIRWLSLAGEQGLAAAWFALSRIYMKSEFSQRSAAEAQRYLERAAGMGHGPAQLECGLHAWRTRRAEADGDVRAAYWLQKAAAQGCLEADAVLAKIAAASCQPNWIKPLTAGLCRASLASQPVLAARLELAELFSLSRAEALLLDVKTADRGHCLVVDIRASYGRSKRRLILLHTAQQRQALDRIARLFESVEGGPEGWEGNYRQRLYRLKTWLQAGLADHPPAPPADQLRAA